MKRLLWKEWNEVKWYLLLLAAGPFVVALITKATDGFGEHLSNSSTSEVSVFISAILALIIYVWAASRIENGLQPNGFGLDWLPVNSGKVWAVKFVPGLIVAVLLPVWIHLSVVMAMGSVLEDNFSAKAMVLWIHYMLAAYTVSFTLAMLLPFAAALVIAVAVTFVGLVSEISVTSDAAYTLDKAILVQVITVAVAVSVVLWLKARHMDGRKKRVTAVITAMIVYALVGSTFYLRLYNEFLMERARHTTSDFLPQYQPPIRLRNLQRTAVAYAPNEIYHQGLKVRVNGVDITLVPAGYADPLTWLPDGNLIFATVGDTHKTVNISEWERKSSSVRLLATIPMPRKTDDLVFVAIGIGCADGSKVAVFTNSLTGESLDLWVIDRKLGSTRLLYPGIFSRRQGMDSAWDGDRFVFRRGDMYWSINYNGKDLKPVLRQEGRWQQ